MSERKKFLNTIKFIKKMGEKPEYEWTKNETEKFHKVYKELNKHIKKMMDDITDLFFDELLPNKQMSEKRFDEIMNEIKNNEIFSLDEIPELKKHNKEDSESDEESHKPLTIAQQNKIIRQIPDDTFTKKEIEQIIKHIRDGSMVDVEQMPEPTKKQPKVKLSDVVLDKKKK